MQDLLEMYAANKTPIFIKLRDDQGPPIGPGVPEGPFVIAGGRPVSAIDDEGDRDPSACLYRASVPVQIGSRQTSMTTYFDWSDILWLSPGPEVDAGLVTGGGGLSFGSLS